MNFEQRIASELLDMAERITGATSNSWTVSVEEIGEDGSKKKVYEKESFDSEKEAKKFIRQMMNKYKLKRHAGRIVNYDDNKQLWTNF